MFKAIRLTKTERAENFFYKNNFFLHEISDHYKLQNFYSLKLKIIWHFPKPQSFKIPTPPNLTGGREDGCTLWWTMKHDVTLHVMLTISLSKKISQSNHPISTKEIQKRDFTPFYINWSSLGLSLKLFVFNATLEEIELYQVS